MSRKLTTQELADIKTAYVDQHRDLTALPPSMVKAAIRHREHAIEQLLGHISVLETASKAPFIDPTHADIIDAQATELAALRQALDDAPDHADVDALAFQVNSLRQAVEADALGDDWKDENRNG